MGFFSERRIRKAVEASLPGLSPDRLDRLPIGELDPALRASAWQTLADRLFAEQAEADLLRAVLERAISAAGDGEAAFEAWSSLAQLEQQCAGREEQALAAYEELLSLAPKNDAVRLELIVALLQGEPARRRERAQALCAELAGPPAGEDGLRLGKALFGAGLLEEAVAILGPLVKRTELELRSTFSAESFEALRRLHEELSLLHDEAYAALHGREAVVTAPARQGQLDARAGGNYVLLAEALMASSGYVPAVVALQPAEEEERRARELLAKGEESLGRTLLGSSLLRRGAVESALQELSRALELDAESFAALLGVGAAMEAQRDEAAPAVEALPALQAPAGLERVVPDLPALTPLERRVVIASAEPLAAFLPALAEQGAVIRLLPIDVRPTDLAPLAGAAGERTEDHRTPGAIGGLAADRLACARVIALQNVRGELGWTFAHELAHLVFFTFAGERRARVEELHARAEEAGYIFSSYAMQNVDELFAGAYEDYLRWRYDCGFARELDEDGVLEEVFAFFDELRAGAAEGAA